MTRSPTQRAVEQEAGKGHTPGPWTVNPFCAQVESASLTAEGGLLPVARLLWPTDDRTEAETEANARLIAAAPEMLEALEAVAALLPTKVCNRHGITAAIAKARGQ